MRSIDDKIVHQDMSTFNGGISRGPPTTKEH